MAGEFELQVLDEDVGDEGRERPAARPGEPCRDPCPSCSPSATGGRRGIPSATERRLLSTDAAAIGNAATVSFRCGQSIEPPADRSASNPRESRVRQRRGDITVIRRLTSHAATRSLRPARNDDRRRDARGMNAQSKAPARSETASRAAILPLVGSELSPSISPIRPPAAAAPGRRIISARPSTSWRGRAMPRF